MYLVIFWTVVFSITTATSIVLLGHRELISGNILSIKGLGNLILNWRFIVSMICALMARFAFIMTNNTLLKIPHLAESSTTITTFITMFSLIVIVIANVLFLKEKLHIEQGLGAVIILVGMWTMLK
ncbi:MAG: hypothetical protein WCI36_05010 [bacterium]